MSKSNMKLSDGNCRFLAWQLLGIRNREADKPSFYVGFC